MTTMKTSRPRAVEHYRAVWPVLEPRRPMRELIEEATAGLPWMLALVRGQQAGPRATWSIRPGRDVPGSGGAAEVLVLDLAVVVRPRDEGDVVGHELPVLRSVRSVAS